MMAQATPANSQPNDTLPPDDAIKVGIEAITSSLQQSVNRRKELDGNALKLIAKKRMRSEVEADPKHSPIVLKYLDQDIELLKEEELVVSKKLDIAMDSLRRSFLDITQRTVERYLSQIMDDVKNNLAAQLQESNTSLMRELKEGIIQATTVDIPHLKQQLEAVAGAQTSGEAKLKADIKEFFDEGKNSIVTDIGKIYRQCAEQIDKVQRQSDTTSEVMLELAASLKSLEEASVNAAAFQDVKVAINSIQEDMSKLATTSSLDELRKMAEVKLKEGGERHTGLERTMEKLQKMFAVLQEQTEDYNRRSQELDIVYDRIKRHIEELKKTPDLKHHGIETSNVTSEDVTRIQHDISTLRNVHSNLNAMVQAAERDVKTIQAEQSRTAEKLSKLTASINSGDVGKSVQNQIGQLSNKISDLAKQVQRSQRRSEVPPSADTAAMHTQIPTNGRNSSPLDHLDDRQLIAKTIDSSKAITYLEAKMVINEQAVYNKLHSLQRDISNLRKRKSIDNGDTQNEAKRTRNDAATPSDIGLQDTVDEHTLQLKDLVSFLAPFRGTILSDTFPENLQRNINKLITVLQQHEGEIQAVHQFLTQLIDKGNVDVLGDDWKKTAPSVFKLQLDSQQRKAEAEHAELMDHVQKLKDLYAKSQEKEMTQQVQIDKLKQQLKNNTVLMEMMYEAMVKNGITIDRMDASNTTHSNPTSSPLHE